MSRRWIAALFATIAVAAGTAFAVPGFVYHGAPTAGAHHATAYVYHGSQPGFVYYG